MIAGRGRSSGPTPRDRSGASGPVALANGGRGRLDSELKERTGFLNWMFRSRKTGRITLAQFPNWQLLVWLLASAVMWLGHPRGLLQNVLRILAPAALALWAGDEALRGVNPFRRLLGVAVLAGLIFSLVRTG
jgi:hypothetical protein